jgi:hypothetical protein
MYFQASSPEPGRFGYIAPFLNQARQIAWDYLKRYSKGMTKKISEAELSVTYFNNAKFTLYGADNPDSFRGLYFDGVVLDEYGLMRSSIWSEIILPTLIDRKGWATFIGTPNGPNHFRDLYHFAKKNLDRWFVDSLPVSVTKLIPLEELDEMRRVMLEEEYEQEMECSFEASTKGAFYAREIKVAENSGRIGAYPADPNLLLHFVFDVGRRDDTAMGAYQEYAERTNMVYAEAANMQGPQYWIKRIEETCAVHGCQRGSVWLPHDAKAKTWGTQRSGVEQFMDAGIRPRIVPMLDKIEGINAARFVFQYVTMNEATCDELVLALKSYHREWDADKAAFTNEEVHDWSSHYADMFRYFALVARFPHSRPLAKPRSKPVELDPDKIILTHYPVTMDQLWKDHDGRARNEYIR